MPRPNSPVARAGRFHLGALAALLGAAGLLGPAGCELALPGSGSASPAEVAVRGSEVPVGLHRCPESGDISSYLSSVKARDQGAYQAARQEWEKEKGAGAVAARLEIYTDQLERCGNVLGSAGAPAPGSQPQQLMLNYLVRYRDRKSASSDFKREIFGFRPDDLRQRGGTVTEGRATGLGPSSSLGTADFLGLQLYLAVWQKNAYTSALVAVNEPAGACQRVTAAVDGRMG